MHNNWAIMHQIPPPRNKKLPLARITIRYKTRTVTYGTTFQMGITVHVVNM